MLARPSCRLGAIKSSARGLQDRRVGLRPHDLAAQVAALQTVQTRRVQAERREQAVDLLERAAADQGERTVDGRLQIGQDRAQALRHVNRVGLALDLDQGAIDVEEKRDGVWAESWRRQSNDRHRHPTMLGSAVVVEKHCQACTKAATPI